MLKTKGGRESDWQRGSESPVLSCPSWLPPTGSCPLGIAASCCLPALQLSPGLEHRQPPACRHSSQEGRGNQAHPSNIFILLLP